MTNYKNSGSTGAVILAAGLSSRMGEFKPLMNLCGKTMIERTIEPFVEAGISPVVVVTGRDHEMLEAALKDFPVTCVFNTEYASCEMLDSVKVGLNKLAALAPGYENVFIEPADVPLYGKDTLLKLLENAKEKKRYALRPLFNGKNGHPILISADLVPEILQYKGERGLKGALEYLDCFINVPVENEGVLLDADTPEDFEKLENLF